jgi:hypothetical protein
VEQELITLPEHLSSPPEQLNIIIENAIKIIGVSLHNVTRRV